jgi:hypothetical protein
MIKTIASLKWRVFKLCCPAHWFPNTPHIIRIWLFLSQIAATIRLKGKVSQDFLLLCFWFFSWISPPQKSAEIFAIQGAPPVSTTPVANLSPVSTTPAANCHWYQQHWRQTMGTISGCRYLKVNLKQKFIYMLAQLSKGVPTKLLKFFSLKIFFICRYRWWTLSCEYLRVFSKKFETALMGKLILEKNQKLKISWKCLFKVIVQVVLHYFVLYIFPTEVIHFCAFIFSIF